MFALHFARSLPGERRSNGTAPSKTLPADDYAGADSNSASAAMRRAALVSAPSRFVGVTPGVSRAFSDATVIVAAGAGGRGR